ncbi:MAG: ZIP family metal transporter [Clostridia bacterium]|nr:ZIP family metal transporter [Clostridia bacterium]
MIPLVGTTLGAGIVFFMKEEMSTKLRKILTGFAGGVMIAASFWSLLEPSLEESSHLGKLSFIPAAIGFLVGIAFLLVIDVATPHVHINNQDEGPQRKGMSHNAKLFLAVTIHNIPEGMAAGVVFAGWMSGKASISITSALALSIGIAIQNFPEGGVVSAPLLANGMSKGKTFLYGFLSGVVEPIAAVVTICATALVVPVLPYFLAFAAGAMIYVVIEELIPEMAEGPHSNSGTISFALGFVTMMILDVALG